MANSLAAHVVLLPFKPTLPCVGQTLISVNKQARSNMKTLFMYYPQEDIFGAGPEKSVGIKAVRSLGEA